jgi:hypothetical protein
MKKPVRFHPYHTSLDMDRSLSGVDNILVRQLIDHRRKEETLTQKQLLGTSSLRFDLFF